MAQDNSPPPPDMNGLLPHMEGSLQQHIAHYDKIQQIAGKAKLMREQLDQLVKLNDTVTNEDLVNAASRLVGKGIGAAEIAGILSEAPEGGEELKGWILQKDMTLRQEEAQLSQMSALSGHNMGVSALRLLGAHSMASAHGLGMEPQSTLAGPQSGTGPAAGAANDLTANPAGGPDESAPAGNAMGA